MPFGEGVALDPLQPPDHLVHEPAHFGEMPRAGAEVVTDPFLDRVGEPGLDLGGRSGERLNGGAGALERCVERRGVGGLLESLLRACDGVFIHGGDDTNCGGWTSTSSITTCRTS